MVMHEWTVDKRGIGWSEGRGRGWTDQGKDKEKDGRMGNMRTSIHLL